DDRRAGARRVRRNHRNSPADPTGVARPRPAALLRPAAALVPRSVGARQPGLQRALGGAVGGRARRRPAAPDLRRGGAAARGAADDFLALRAWPGAEDPGAPGGTAARRLPGGAAGGSAGGRGPASGAGGGPAPLRPRAGTAPPSLPAPSLRAGARPPRDDA